MEHTRHAVATPGARRTAVPRPDIDVVVFEWEPCE
jgi:hypothetical protein